MQYSSLVVLETKLRRKLWRRFWYTFPSQVKMNASLTICKNLFVFGTTARYGSWERCCRIQGIQSIPDVLCGFMHLSSTWNWVFFVVFFRRSCVGDWETAFKSFVLLWLTKVVHPKTEGGLGRRVSDYNKLSLEYFRFYVKVIAFLFPVSLCNSPLCMSSN